MSQQSQGSREPVPQPSGSVGVVGVVSALVVFFGFVLFAMARNGWVFEYALDDVYIHLAMAEQIARGGYGINPGELASAASSPLYPFLLAPFAGSSLQVWLPLFWNVIALGVSAALFARVLVLSGLGGFALPLAALAPLALATYVTAFSGMENMAHVAAALAVVIGLWGFAETGRLGWLLPLGVIFSTAFRLEGIALGLAAGGVVFLFGRARAGLALMLLAILPVALLSVALVAMGLEPLPNSILAKLQDTGGGGPIARLVLNAQSVGGSYLLGLTCVLAVLGTALLGQSRVHGYVVLAVAAAGLGHMAFGSIGWIDRYEAYAKVAVVAALALGLSRLVGRKLCAAGVSLALLVGLVTHVPIAISVYAWNPTAIAAQHKEMARFAKDHAMTPVAVNDIGYVAYRNPNYVLDLWGLASSEALAVRLDDPAPGWAGPLVEAKDVELAMIYDYWLEDAVPETWQRLGILRLDIPNAFLGGRDVAFYATRAGSVSQLSDAIAKWELDLHPRATFLWERAR